MSRRHLYWNKLRPLSAPLLTVLIFFLIFRKVPFHRFQQALGDADYFRFFGCLLPFSVLYFALDTVVLLAVMRWFHERARPIRYVELLPVRAVDYLVSVLNHKLSQGAMIVYLGRKLDEPLLKLTGTILFLDLLQRTHLVLWATVGMCLVVGAIPRVLFLIPVATLAGWSVLLLYMRAGRPPEWTLFHTFRVAPLKRYVQVLLLKAPLLLAAVAVHHFALPSFGIEVPFFRLLATLPIIFLVGALPVTVAHLGTTQAAWLYFHGAVADASLLLAYSLAAHLTFMLGNAVLGLVFLPRAYRELFGEAKLKEVPA
ncbi:MAG: hypothetical protein ACE5JI_03450 [Acidobacteriota bacterium]